MANRNRSSQYGDDQQNYGQKYDRQSEQSQRGGQNDDGGYGSTGGGYRSQGGFGGYENQGRSGNQSYDRQRGQMANYNQDSNSRGSDYDSFDDYDRGSMNRGYSSNRNDQEHQYFRPDDFGGDDYTRGSYGGGYSGSGGYSGGRSGGGYAGGSGGSSYNRFGSDNGNRGFLAKAGDEISSWFGDDDAERRRNNDQDHSGRGPANYSRSNERLLEDACERLTHDRYLNASNINVTADDNEITLDGTVESRQAKRRAEDCLHDISGVKHVQNNLRVDDSMNSMSNNSSSSGTSSNYSTSNDTTSRTDTTTS